MTNIGLLSNRDLFNFWFAFHILFFSSSYSVNIYNMPIQEHLFLYILQYNIYMNVCLKEAIIAMI